MSFTLPLLCDYGATFLWAISGALIAANRGYDLSGVVAISLVSATGGGLLRDGLFLQNGPPVIVRKSEYLIIVAAASLLVLLTGARLRHRHFSRLVQIVDAIGLGAYAVVGMQLAAASGMSKAGIVLVGMVNACGGGVLRDILMRQEPEVFKPGTLTAMAALAGCLVFVLLKDGFDLSADLAAVVTILTTSAIRALSIRYDIRTRPLPGFERTRDR